MLSKEDNEILCKVSPGTMMGDLMRQFWIPVLTTAELPAPDSPPRRVRLLGENLIAFRDTSGEVGLFANSCPHRGASMFFGRNEEDGLRCVYHGWKFDVSGACVDMPSEPAESNFKNKVRIRAYPCRERAGIVWTYMGPREVPPPLPMLQGNLEGDRPSIVTKTLRECNYFQGLEGDIDTSHVGYLHRVFGRAAQPGTFEWYLDRDRHPQYAATNMPYGTIYGAYRPAEPDTHYWRIGQFLLPFYTQPGTGILGGPEGRRGYRLWVPLDDDHTMFWMIMPNLGEEEAPLAPGPGFAGRGFQPDTTDWLGRWKLQANASNDYQVDREMQRDVNYTGIGGIHLQDQAITESMGTIYERTQEHLGTSDTMVILTRRRAINAAKALREHGTLPASVDDPDLFMTRSGGVVLPRDVDWLEATKELRHARVDDKLVAQSRVGLT
ncbi:MAG TPA: Rieske 2Fe-2S domain-containing protein [Dehalococcoidia bacterium]|nr:Rieske 2Fe-2S domain-containing protein [Dehalococcoidia bacterium]